MQPFVSFGLITTLAETFRKDIFKAMADKKRGITIRFEEPVFKFFEDNSYNVQSLVTRLVDKYIQEQETEQKKVNNLTNHKHE